MDLEIIQLNIPGVLDLALLHKLSIRLTDDWDWECRQGIKIFETAPNLQEVLIRDPLPSFLSLPWQQLTTVTAQMVSVATCMKLMGLIPNLVKCSLSPFLAIGDAIGAARRERLYFPQLQHLTLFSTTTVDIILDFITLSALQTLEIRRANSFDPKNLDCFLKRSSPPLQKLVISVLDIEGIPLILSPSFTTLPLVELQLWIPTGDFAVELFSLLGRGVKFLPQLRSLSFTHSPLVVYNLHRTALSTLLQLAAQPITRRWKTIPGCAKLRTFHVIEEETDDSSRYPEEDMIPFKRLCAQGMDVYIGS